MQTIFIQRVFKGHSKGTRKELGHLVHVPLECPWRALLVPNFHLKTLWRALGHSSTWGTRALKRHLGIQTLGQSKGTWALSHSGTWELEVLYLEDSCSIISKRISVFIMICSSFVTICYFTKNKILHRYFSKVLSKDFRTLI